ncbi:MAG TPA: hypothetical protein VJL81_06915 [Solirubrobacterales bacterium]|nr:hypothetical protein [Solirubrobacterales bacterium]
MNNVAETSTDHTRTSTDTGRPALVALLAVQIIIGYEWLTSGITKVTSGDFVSGLAADLTEESRDSAHCIAASSTARSSRTPAPSRS